MVAKRGEKLGAGICLHEVEVIRANRKISERTAGKLTDILRVAPYARVSTDLEEQLSRYKSQVDYYTDDVDGNVLGEATYDLIADPPDNSSVWMHKTLRNLVKKNTRTLRVSIIASKSDADPANIIGDYIEFDGIELTLIQEPVMNVIGNNISITDGDTTPSTTDDTDIGSIVVNSSITKTFTIENSGAAALNLSGTPIITVGGMYASDFAVTMLPNSPVAVDGTTTFDVTFTPSGAGVRTATITIANNTEDGSYVFDIAGTGIGITVPTVTTNTSMTSITSTTATAGGNVTVDGGVSVTERGIVYGIAENPTITDGTAIKLTPTVISGTGAFTVNITGLSVNTLYHVRAYAKNSQGTSYGSDISFTTDTVPITNLTSSGKTSTTADVTWTAASRATGIIIEQSPTGANTWTTAATGTIAAGATTATVSGLSIGTGYDFRLVVTGGANEGTSNEVTVTTDTTPITNFTNSGRTSTTAEFIWTAASGATEVVLQQSPSGANTWTTATTGILAAGATTATVTGLSVGTGYDFRLVVTGGTNAGTSNSTVSTAGQEGTLTCDNVVLAMGFSPDIKLYNALKDKVEILNIGDSVKVRKVLDAVHEAYDAILRI
ncbi:MAG: choice-of-anchor D domain-containing protein [Anaerocolumna sp.]